MALPEPIEHLISLLKKFPGVGEKSARRMAFYVLQQGNEYGEELSRAVGELNTRLTTCEKCGNLTEFQPCPICSDPLRDRSLLCVTESLEDLVSIEQSGLYNGLYFVLGLSLSPLEDREKLPAHTLEKLLRRFQEYPISEVIIATNPRIEGDMTFYALLDALRDVPVKKSRLAYGLPVGGSIEFADRVTLHAALESRQEVKG